MLGRKRKGRAAAPAFGASGAPSLIASNPIAAEEEQIDQRSAGNAESIGSAHGGGGGAGAAMRAPAAPPVEPAPAAASATVQRRLAGPYMTRSAWNVEMNEARRLYLSTHGIIDSMDQYMSNLNCTTRSWKYWHAAMLHYKELVVVMSYDMYSRVAGGRAGDKYKVDKPLGFAAFRERLSSQMMAYDPSKCTWNVEMNEARRLYLSTYGIIDSMDQYM